MTKPKPTPFNPSEADRGLFDAGHMASAKDAALRAAVEKAFRNSAGVAGVVSTQMRRTFDAGYIAHALGMPCNVKSMAKALAWFDFADKDRPQGWKTAYDAARQARSRLLAKLDLQSDAPQGGARPSAATDTESPTPADTESPTPADTESPTPADTTAINSDAFFVPLATNPPPADMTAVKISSRKPRMTQTESEPEAPAEAPAEVPAEVPAAQGLTLPILVSKAEWYAHAQNEAAFMVANMKKNRKSLPGPLRSAYEAFIAAVKAETSK
jgi:hypothetical protein